MFNQTAASQQMRSSCLPVYIDLLQLPRPLAPCILTTCTLSCTNELLQREGGEKEGGGAVSMWNLAVGLCAVHRGGCLPANCLNSVAGPLSLQPHHIRVWKTASTQQNQQGVVWHHGWQTAASPPYIWKCGCNIVQHDREKKTSSGGNIFPQDLIYKSIFICMYLLCMAFWCRFPSQTFSLEQHFNQNSMKINYLSMHGDYPSPCTATGLHLV